MTPRDVPRPTDAELAILRVIWRLGSATVREIHDALLQDQPKTGYTTVLKILQIMTDKGIVVRDESQRAHVYAAKESEQSTRGRLVRHLVDRAFDGSATALVMQALSTKKASPNELATIRAMLEKIEGERR
ncbi:MAG: BlaI/MecI/CopY family transcriptional regulator [Acidobacteria bacterium]|nr:BlaI/MecI/CopY family transcriptional regulator [Acidobacteriota bacterium]